MASTNNDALALQLVYGDLNLGIKGEGFHYIFSYWRGGPDSLFAAGREWVYRTPKPAFWRALTDNDRGCQFQNRSGQWLAADQFLPCKDCKVYVDGELEPGFLAPANNRFTGEERAQSVKLVYTFETIIEPKTQVTVAYEVVAGGNVNVSLHYQGCKGLPELPVFGWRLIMPTKATGYAYEGLSGETYPDRMAGGIPGVYEVKGLPVTPYMVPQECGNHMATQWVKVSRNTSLDASNHAPAGYLKVQASEGADFAFSCLPYTAMELESATHIEELPRERRTVLCINGAVRGVGGIDSWGSDVETAYHISAEEDHDLAFTLSFGY